MFGNAYTDERARTVVVVMLTSPLFPSSFLRCLSACAGALQGWRLETRLDFFERRWAYFAGFGCPAALLGVLFPRLIASGVFAMAFPMFIILAVIAKPLPLPLPAGSITPSSSGTRGSSMSSASASTAPFRLPIFHFAKRANLALLKQIKQTAPSKQSNREASSRATPRTAGAQWPAPPSASDSLARPASTAVR